MSKTTSVLFLGVVAVGFSVVLGGCGGDGTSTIGTSSSSSSSSSGSGGGGGGEAGGGGMAGMGGAGGSAGAGGGTAGMGGTGGAGGGSICAKPGNACGDCLFDQCNPAYCECADEPACLGLIECIQKCPPMMPGCAAACYEKNATGYAEFTLAASCAGTLCLPSCPGADQVKPCDLCLAQKCEMQLENCIGNSQCLQLIDCMKTCAGDKPCEQQCAQTYPNGALVAQAVYTCAAAGCGNECK
jgi:hypothetical protein